MLREHTALQKVFYILPPIWSLYQGFSADGISAYVTPQNCKKYLFPYDVFMDNAGVLSGGMFTLLSISGMKSG